MVSRPNTVTVTINHQLICCGSLRNYPPLRQLCIGFRVMKDIPTHDIHIEWHKQVTIQT